MIGVDLGGTKALAGVVKGDRAIVHRAFRRLPPDLDADGLLDLLIGAIHDAEEAVGRQAEAVGLGVPSLVDRATGTAVATVHLPFHNTPVRDLVSERLGVPVVVDNDATLAMLAEHRLGAARGSRTAAMLTLGTGIGGGLVAHGEVVRGASGAAGEWGHMVVELGGERCTGDCPNRGCLETVVSGPALGRRVRALAEERPESAFAKAAALGRELDGSLATELAHDGDIDACELLERMGEVLGVGIANIVNILNPQVVVVGGGVMAAGELLLGPARRTMSERALAPSRDQVRIERSHFGDASGMVGAALMATDRLAELG